MKDFIDFLESETKKNNRRKMEIPVAISCYEKLELSAKDIKNNIFPSHLWPAKGIQAYVIIDALAEINGSIVESIKKEYYSAVEGLFRISIEHSVNIIYIFSSGDIQRSRSFLRHAIEGMADKSSKRMARAQREDDSLDLLSANRVMGYANQLKAENPKLFNDDSLRWPNAFERFKSIGDEKGYRNMYSTASDSVHAMSEDVINCIIEYQSPEEVREALFSCNKSYRESLAVYLVFWSLEYFSKALICVANEVSKISIERIEKEREKICEVLNSHEIESAEGVANSFPPNS